MSKRRGSFFVRPESMMPSRLHLPGTPYVPAFRAKRLFYGGHPEQEYCSGVSEGQLRHSARYGVSASRIQVAVIISLVQEESCSPDQ